MSIEQLLQLRTLARKNIDKARRNKQYESIFGFCEIRYWADKAIERLRANRSVTPCAASLSRAISIIQSEN